MKANPLGEVEYVAVDYSIADMAACPRTVNRRNQGQVIDDFPNLKRWSETIRDRPATVRAYAKGEAIQRQHGMTDEEKTILFGQTAASIAVRRQDVERLG